MLIALSVGFIALAVLINESHNESYDEISNRGQWQGRCVTEVGRMRILLLCGRKVA